MTRYEYTTDKFHELLSVQDLNTWGLDGWQLAAVVREEEENEAGEALYSYYFKREMVTP